MFSSHLNAKVFFKSLRVGLVFLPVAIFVSLFEFALPLGMEDIAGSAPLVGLFVGMGWIIVTLIDLLAGDFADNIGKKIGALLGVTIYLLFTLLFGFTQNIWILFVLLIFAYIGYDLFYISIQGFIVAQSTKKSINSAVEGFYPAWDFGFIFGPLLGAFLITSFGQQAVYFSSIILCGLTLVLGLFIPDIKKEKIVKRRSLKEFFSYLSFLMKKDFWLLMGSMSCAFWWMLMVISIPLFFFIEEGDIWLSAFVLTAFMLPIFLTDLIVDYVASTRNRRFWLVSLGYILSGLALISFFLADNPVLMAVCAALSTIGFQTVWAIFDIEAGLLAPKGKEAMTESVFFFGKNIGFDFAPFFFAGLVAFFGLKSPFLAFGIISLLFAFIFVLKHKKMNFK